MTIGEVLDATSARWFRWHYERTPIVCPPTLLPSPELSGSPRPVALRRREPAPAADPRGFPASAGCGARGPGGKGNGDFFWVSLFRAEFISELFF